MVLGHTQVPGALLEVKSRLDEVAVLLQGQLSSAGGDWHCEGVDDEPLALPQVDLKTFSCSEPCLKDNNVGVNYGKQGPLPHVWGAHLRGGRGSHRWSLTGGTRHGRCACGAD